MIHDAHGIVIGNATDMTEMADLLDKMSDNIASIYAERAGSTVPRWRDAMRAETWYSAQEAVDAGLADSVKGVGKTDDTFDLSIFSYAGRDQAPAPQPPPVEGEFDLDQITLAFEEAFA